MRNEAIQSQNDMQIWVGPSQGGHIPAKIKFPEFSPVLDNFSLCYFYVISNS